MVRNHKYYFLQGGNVRWTIWLNREEDWGRAEAGNYYLSRWAAESARSLNKTLTRIFVRKGKETRICLGMEGR